jgi:hypothetical protein
MLRGKRGMRGKSPGACILAPFRYGVGHISSLTKEPAAHFGCYGNGNYRVFETTLLPMHGLLQEQALNLIGSAETIRPVRHRMGKQLGNRKWVLGALIYGWRGILLLDAANLLRHRKRDEVVERDALPVGQEICGRFQRSCKTQGELLRVLVLICFHGGRLNTRCFTRG